MRFLFLLFSVLSLNTFATVGDLKTLIFHWKSRRSNYACAYVELQLQKHLRELGLQEVETECVGGIDPDVAQDHWQKQTLRTQLLLPPAPPEKTENIRHRVVLNGYKSCAFNVALIQKILKKIKYPVLSETHSCEDSEGSYYFEIEVLR